MLSCLSQYKIIIINKEEKRNYIYDIDYGDGFMGIYLSPNSSNCLH